MLSVLDVISPKVETLCMANPLTADQQVIRYLRSNELKQTLPAMIGSDKKPIGRRFLWTSHVAAWFRSLIWVSAYSSARDHGAGAWNATDVHVFTLKPGLPHQRR